MLLVGGQAQSSAEEHKNFTVRACTCTYNGDTDENDPDFAASVTSLMLYNLLERFSLLLQLEYTKCLCIVTHTHTHVLQYCSGHLHHLTTHYCWSHLHHQTVSYEEETGFFNKRKTLVWHFPQNMEPDR
jgi:hypothetical protein